MDSAEYDGFAIEKNQFKQEFLSLIQTSPNRAADVAFGLLQKINRLEKQLAEVSGFYETTISQTKTLKSALKNAQRLAREQAASNEVINAELNEQIERLQSGQTVRETLEKRWKEEKEKRKGLEKEVKKKNSEMGKLNRELKRERKKAESVPKLLANIEKLNERKKKLVEEKKFEQSRKQLYLEQNRVLKDEARRNLFKEYDCHFHPDDEKKPYDTGLLDFKNKFFD